MENQNQKKNPNKHFIIALSIIGAALIVALIIATVTIVSDLNNKINGKTISELYSSFESSITSESNYSYVISKSGSGTLYTNDKKVAANAEIESIEKLNVNGEDFYYEKTLKLNGVTITSKITYISGADGEKGVTYIYYGETGANAQMSKVESATNDFKNNSIMSIKSLIWDYDDLFKKSDIVEKNGGYLIEMNKEFSIDDPALVNALKANATAFFEKNAGQSGSLLNQCLRDFEDYDYSVMYDGNGRPLSVIYSYTMGNGNLFVGDLSVTAAFEYGNAVIDAPANESDYIWSTGK